MEMDRQRCPHGFAGLMIVVLASLPALLATLRPVSVGEHLPFAMPASLSPVVDQVFASLALTADRYLQSLQWPRKRISITSPIASLCRLLPAVSFTSSMHETVPQSTQTKCGWFGPCSSSIASNR